MISSKPVRIFVALFTVVAWILPADAFGDKPLPCSKTVTAATPLVSAVAPVDVAVDDEGWLKGSVVNEMGAAQPAIAVRLIQDGIVLSQTQTDAAGQFAFEVKQGGFYQVLADNRSSLLRCWAPGTAPPHARRAILICREPVQRGQIHPAASTLANPWIITGVVVAAIVIPVALHNNRSDRKAASE